jgi:capsular exopolysaccharide synthesis family protein
VERFWQLRAVRRFWWVVVATTFVAAGVAFVVTETSSSPGPPRRTFEATTQMYGTQTGGVGFGAQDAYSDPNTVIAFLPVVADAVKERLGFAGTTEQLLAMVEATVNEDAQNFIDVTASAPDRDRAEEVSIAFAEGLLGYLSDRIHEQNLEEVPAVEDEIKILRKQIRDAKEAAEAAEAAGGQGTQQTNVSTLEADLERKRNERDELLDADVDPGFQTLPTSVAQVDATGFEAPRSLTVRLGIAIALGLLGGLALALLIGRIDTRIRTKRAAEERFGLPVLAEIPVMPRRARAKLITSSEPGSRHAEAFRILGAELVRGPRAARRSGNGEQPGGGAKPPKVVVVTSAGPGEGKTTVAANLAVAMADTERKVIVLSCDFRRPKIHALFGVEVSPGLAEFLAEDDGGSILDRVAVPVGVDGVRLVPSGRVHAQPTELLHSPGLRRLLNEARDAADVVIIDTTPILAVSDAAFIAPDADAVLLVARSGRITGEVAERTSELLARLGCPAVGVALNRAGETVVPKGYRAYYERRPEWARPEAENGAREKVSAASEVEAADAQQGGDSPTSRVTSEEDRV